MMLLDPRPEHSTTDRRRGVDLTADELAERTQVSRVTRVPSGPTGLWSALAVASVRRLREDLPTVEVADLGPRPSMFDGDPGLAVPLDDLVLDAPSPAAGADGGR